MQSRSLTREHSLLYRIEKGNKMIRTYTDSDVTSILEIWLESNCKAHDFIDEMYWKNNMMEVKQMLPQATIYIYEELGSIIAFIGLMDNFIAGIFVRNASQSRGIGKALLNHAKDNHTVLCLHVYEKNHRALRFYERENFVISSQQIDEGTGEVEFVMDWSTRI